MAAALAVALSIAAMMKLRCLHPPGGAVALTSVLGGTAVTGLGYQFVIWPIGLNSLCLLVMALFFNHLAGRRYPHGEARSQRTPWHGRRAARRAPRVRRRMSRRCSRSAANSSI